MAEPRYDLTSVRATPLPGGGFVDVIWNAVIVDSTGAEFRHGRGYSMLLGAGEDETARAAMSAKLAAARTDADVMTLVHADAARVLAEIEARVTGGAVEAAPVVLFAAPAPAPVEPSDDADPDSDPFPATPEPIED
jgi:hypothetical protein